MNSTQESKPVTDARISEVLDGLNKAQAEYHARMGWTHSEPDKWHAKIKSKYIALDCGSSGAFLVEKITGELFNIKGYGVPDHNKKKKANLGNLATVDPVWLHTKRYNYLR